MRFHKGSGQWYVHLEQIRHYLGSVEDVAAEKYHRLLAEWRANGKRLPVPQDDITIVEICARYLAFAKGYYRLMDGTLSDEYRDITSALRPLKKLYATSLAAEFGPRRFKAVRQVMIDRDNGRKYINAQAGRIKRMFKWATEEELIEPSVLHGLLAVAGLKRGRSGVRENNPVIPVPLAHIDAVEPFVSRQIWGLIRLQLHTASRPGELLKLRVIDLDTSGNIWTYTPSAHKNAYRGHTRTIYFGPKAQTVIQEFMTGKPVSAYLFSPRDAITEKAAKASTHRRPDQKPNPRDTDRTVGDHYTVNAYRRSITRACEAAGIPKWVPLQIRHAAATAIRKEYGLESAQVVLGHARADVTQLYAEINREKAIETMRKIG